MIASRPSNARQQTSILSPNTADLFLANLSTPHSSEYHYGPSHPSPKTGGGAHSYNASYAGPKQAFVPGVGFRPTPQQSIPRARRPSGVSSVGSAFSPTSVYSDSEVESDSSGGPSTDESDSGMAPVVTKTRLSRQRPAPAPQPVNTVIYSSPSGSQDDSYWHDSDNYQSPVWASRWARNDSVVSISTNVDSNGSRRPSFQSFNQNIHSNTRRSSGSDRKNSYDISRQGSLDYSAMQSGRSGVRRASNEYDRKQSYDSSRRGSDGTGGRRGSDGRRGSYDRRSSYDRPMVHRGSVDNPLLTRALGGGRRQSLEHFLGVESKDSFLQARRGSFDPSREFGLLNELGGLGLSGRRVSVDSIGERERMKKLGEIGALNRRESEVLDLAIGKRRGGVYEIPADVKTMVAASRRGADTVQDNVEIEGEFDGGMVGGVYIVGNDNQHTSHWSPSTVSSDTESSNSDSGSGDSLSPGPTPPQELAHIEMPQQFTQQPNLSLTFSFEIKNSPLNDQEGFDPISAPPALQRSLSVDSEASSIDDFETSVYGGEEVAFITTGERYSMASFSTATVLSQPKSAEPPTPVPTSFTNRLRRGGEAQVPTSPDLSYLASCISIGSTPPAPVSAPPPKSDFRQSQSSFVSHRETLSHSKSMPALAPVSSAAAGGSMPPADRMATFLASPPPTSTLQPPQQQLQYNRISPSRTDSNLTITGKRSSSSLQNPVNRNAGTWEQPWMAALTEMQRQRGSTYSSGSSGGSSGSESTTSPPAVNPVFAKYEGQRYSAPSQPQQAPVAPAPPATPPKAKAAELVSPKSSPPRQRATPTSAPTAAKASYAPTAVNKKRWESLPFEDAFVARTKAENIARQRLEEWVIPSTTGSISHFSRPTPPAAPVPQQQHRKHQSHGATQQQQQQQGQQHARFSLPPPVRGSSQMQQAGPSASTASLLSEQHQQQSSSKQNRLTRMFTKVEKCM